MITFKKIKWKNFLSTGQTFTEIDFLKSDTTLIIGTNGAGKSTVLDALTFVLFNKPFRKINKPQLLNSVNEKDCLVEIEFEINSNQYVVKRGIKPNIFDIVVNGKLMDKQSEDKLNQKILEENILKLNYKSFTQIVILGSSNFIPFMQLTTANRREVIEDLLDIRVFSIMSGISKDKIKLLKNDVKSDSIKKESMEEKIKMQERFIEELKNRENESINVNKEKIETLNSEIEDITKENDKHNEKIQKYNKELTKLIGASEKLGKLNNLKGKLSHKVSEINLQHEFFTNNTVCPTCTQNIDDKFRLNRIDEIQNKIRDLQQGYADLEESINIEKKKEFQFNKVSKEILKLNNEVSQNNTRILLNQRQIKSIEDEIQVLTDQLTNRNTEHEKLDDFKKQLNTLTDELMVKKENILNYEFIFTLLKDDGVKTKIIKKYIPVINQQVNRYLQLMDFYINFHLDEEFNETVKSPIHEFFTYSSFSEGEKARIDLALLFAWREIARIKNSTNCNILLFDEVFDSSLDGFGADEFLKIIRYVVKDTNVFVISHKSDLQEKFDTTLKFEKKNNFSYKTEI